MWHKVSLKKSLSRGKNAIRKKKVRKIVMYAERKKVRFTVRETMELTEQGKIPGYLNKLKGYNRSVPAQRTCLSKFFTTVKSVKMCIPGV